MAGTFPQIRSAAVDERAHSVFYRQTQLEKLCKALVDNATDIREAIATDYDHNQAEIAAEFSLAISEVKRDYASLNPEYFLKEEYLIALGKDAKHIRKPVGIVYVIPSTHTLFYSVVVSLSAAIAAGNCVIVLLESNLRAVSSLLRNVLTAALDRNTFAIAPAPIKDQALLDSAVIVDQAGGERWPKVNYLSSPTGQPTVAIVDRTADVQLAARELAAARFGFGGNSPYAPDIVLVNEFAMKAFIEAVISICIQRCGQGTVDGGGSKEKPTSFENVGKSLDALRKAYPSLRTVLQDKKQAVVELPARNRDVLAKKRRGLILILHAMRSLDDAIDLTRTAINGTALAAYHFGDASSGKYLSQFVDAEVSFVNHVPRNILVGPAFPTTRPVDPVTRYPPEIFSTPRPAFIKPSLSSKTIEAALTPGNIPVYQDFLAEATRPLAIMKRSRGGSIGFFERGLLINAGVILTAITSVAGVGVYLLWRHTMPLSWVHTVTT